MDRDLDELRARLDGLARDLSHLRSRLDELERRVGASAQGVEPAPPDAGDRSAGDEVTPPGPAEALRPGRVIPLIGRTLVILGGAYLLRAISEAGVIPARAGAAAALAYAVWWLIQADRSGGRGRHLSASFYGLAAVAVAYPLIWETTARFGFLTPGAAAAYLVIFSALGIAVAWRRRLGELVWTITLVTVVTTLLLIVKTHDMMPFTVALLLVAIPVEALAVRDRWLGLRWPVALGLDAAVVLLFSAAVRQEIPPGSPEVSPGGAIAVGVALPGLYLASISARTLVRERSVSAFEVVQVALALLLGFGGVLRLVAFTQTEEMPVGIAGLLLGAACYVAAFASIDRSLGRGRNFYTYTTFAGLLILFGTYIVLSDAALALTWSLLAVGSIALGGLFDRITLRIHGALYMTAAAVVGGLVTSGFHGLLANPARTWQPVPPPGMAVAVFAAVCFGILVAAPARKHYRWFEQLPEAIVGAVIVWSAAGMAAASLAGPAMAAFAPTPVEASVAACRTGVIAVLAVGLAWSGRRWSLQGITWLVYPVLVGGGLKLLLEDFRHGQPATLFVGLALYGTALILTPRLMRVKSGEPELA